MKRYYATATDDKIPTVEKLYRQNQQSYATAGGFNEDDDFYEEKRERLSEAIQKKRDRPYSLLVAPDVCSECGGTLFNDAFLWIKFNYPVCDRCRDEVERHKLIARTEAKHRYLLKDCDLDLRRPPLRFISKKNPHNPRYGDMKLYLKPQLEERAVLVHGSFEKLEETRQAKRRHQETMAEKRFEQKISRMRREIRGSHQAAVKTAASTHEHKFGEEQHDSKRGNYWKKCALCDYELRYEKL